MKTPATTQPSSLQALRAWLDARPQFCILRAAGKVRLTTASGVSVTNDHPTLESAILTLQASSLGQQSEPRQRKPTPKPKRRLTSMLNAFTGGCFRQGSRI